MVQETRKGSKSEIVLTWYDHVWNKGRLDLIEKLYKPAPEKECLLPGASVPLSETQDFIALMNDLVADKTVRVVHAVEDGDWVSVMVELTGVNADTKNPVFLRWQVMCRVSSDGYILEFYPSTNFISLFEQMGLLPENTFELLLGGNVLR